MLENIGPKLLSALAERTNPSRVAPKFVKAWSEDESGGRGTEIISDPFTGRTYHFTL